MAVITDAERKKQRNRELKREYYAKNKEKRVAQSKEWYRKRREEELALRNNKTPILPQTPFSALFTDFLLIGIRKND
nr:MAG TPA: hypothetical protein [Caudoviricetes sp.]